MPRFALDPRDADSGPRQPPTAPPAAAPPPARPPAAPVAAPLAAPLAQRVERATAAVRARPTLAIAVAAVLLLGGSVSVGAMYALDAGPFAYPEQYLLRGDEMPRGLVDAPVNSEARSELGLTENPGEVDPAHLEELAENPRPDRAFVQGLMERADDEPRVIIVALQYANEDDAKSGAGRAQALCMFSAGSAVLRDGDVVVLVINEDDGDSWVPTVVAALKAQNDDLSSVCGGRAR